MKFDLTWTITAIIAVTSILSPVIVTLINTHHNYKIRRLEIDSKIKQEVLSNFAKSINDNFSSKFVSTDFHKDLNLLFVYFDVDEKLVERIISTDYTDVLKFQKDVTKLMKSLSKQIKYK